MDNDHTEDFNFLTESPEIFDSSDQPKEPPYVGPNLKSAVKMTPRKFAESVLEVYNQLGGASWLLTQAAIDPKAFIELLKKLIPKSMQLEDLSGLHIHLIDQFGNEVEVNTGAQGVPLPSLPVQVPDPAIKNDHSEPGQLQIATGGNPLPDSDTSDPSRGELNSQDINIQDIFE